VRAKIQGMFGLIVIGILGYVAIILAKKVGTIFMALNPTIAAGIITGATTIIVATFTITYGKILERKKDIESHYRTIKTEIYNDFLKEFFKMFFESQIENKEVDFVTFLRDWQRKMIIYGGDEVLAYYIVWMAKIKTGSPDADSIFMTEKLFCLIRKDLGNSSAKLQKGFFAHIMLTNPGLLLSMAAKNPKVTFEELAIMEKSLLAECETT
jgi:hypothetical protein